MTPRAAAAPPCSATIVLGRLTLDHCNDVPTPFRVPCQAQMTCVVNAYGRCRTSRRVRPRELLERIPPEVRDELIARGHKLSVDGPWSHGQVTAVAREPNGVLSGAASPRGRVAYVMGR